ncbi:TRAP-type mannitol/chloroaromatic compound transport system, periplasmic component [Methylophaga frappieri]|uniref:TRAP-type mannitol/chloroaromatic compound transport system, periplasmic component n=1 Tax=Methylophaga frappieri (strain ATCC BAA-2434 / DSM 25690 / JAM7) TaxID=754477 RepID=I1YHK0_METFJ|nr:TRAP transporter substrate-binding protein DctP [Methylophaga frappieri]AFJ02393.1 TRAP-type mannitol/chloroaromatic compound transport system, periplasmic component [Methylophaga frappieri]
MKCISLKWLAMPLAFLLLTACEPPDAVNEDGSIDLTKVYRWKMVTTWPPGFPVLQEGAERFAESLAEMSNGRLQVKVFAGGELIPALQTFDAVSQGTVEMGHGSAYYWAGKVPEAQFFSTVPFGMNPRGMNAWLYSGGGLELWNKVYAPYHVKPFPLGNTGIQMGGWFNEPIHSVADLNGLKMRIPGLGGKVFAKAGGNPVLLAASEVYTALERNTIDATEWVSPYHDQRLGLYRAADYYYYPGWHEPGAVLELSINSRAWATLPPDLQKMVEQAAMAENLRMASEMEYLNAVALAELRERGVDIRAFPDDVMQHLKQLTQETLMEEAAANPKFKTVYDAYKTFRDQDKTWTDISEDAYLSVNE